VDLQLPDGWTAIHYGAFPCVAIPLRLPQGNCFAARVLEKVDSDRSDTLLIWDSAGRLLYHEYTRTEISRIYAVWDGAHDVLVARFGDSIMMLADVRDRQ